MELYKLYNGEITLQFDKLKHIYSVNDKIAYGVTSTVGILSKPALMYWAVNEGVKYLGNNLKPGKALDEIQIKDLMEGVRTAHRSTGGKAMGIGKIGHKWLEDYVNARLAKKEPPKMPVNKELRRGIEGFFKWAKENKVALISSEQKIYSKKHEYAGTYDLEAMVNGEKTIIDFKFANAIYNDYLLQASAYLRAREEETEEKYNGGIVILRLSKKESDMPFEAKRVTREEVDRYFRAFLSCLHLYRWRMENKRLEILAKANK